MTRATAPPRGRVRDLLPLSIVLALVLARAWFLFRYPVDSDEAQHLHVIYGWLNGEIPYRDRFDNHTPLFHLLFIPFAAWAGETPDVVLWARVAQIPLSFLLPALVLWLGVRLFDRRTALWGTALSLAFADWSLKSLEFRPDVLWTGLWLAALIVLARSERGRAGGRFFGVGLILGAALTASIKTTFLGVGLLFGWGITWLAVRDFREQFPPRRIVLGMVAGGAGFLVVPAIVFGGFILEGAGAAMKFCLFEVNRPDPPGWRALWFLLGMPIASALVLWQAGRWHEYRGVRVAILLSAAAYALLVAGFSPSSKKQTFLPAYPVLFLGLAAATERLRGRDVVLGAACVGLAVHQVFEATPWRDGMAPQRELLADVLALSRPGEAVMDLKGETVFRDRPVYLAYVLATTRGVEAGRLEDAKAETLFSMSAVAAVRDGAGFPGQMRKFLKDFYVPAGAGWLRVPGQVLKPSWENGDWIERVDVPVAGEYVILKDGECVDEVVVSNPGPQVFNFGTDRSRRLLYWKRAWEAGYPPKFDEIGALP